MSKINKRSTVCGISLITIGVQAAIDQFTPLPDTTAIIILALGGLAALGVYLTDKSDWGLLVPVYVLWVIAGIVAFTKWADTDSNLVPAAILFLIALPFLAVFYRDQKEYQWALIPAYVLLVIIPIILFGDSRTVSDFVATYVLTVIAIPFL